MKVAAFVQARMGSRRLPGKSLERIWDEMPLVEVVLRRAAAARRVDEVVLVTARTAADEALVERATAIGVAAMAGPEEDVLGRFVEALEDHPAEAVVRICADNPFVDPFAIDDLVDLFERAQPCDYASNHTAASGLPDGAGCEIVGADALRHAAERCRDPEEREHVTQYVVAHPEEFRIATAPPPADPYPFLKLDVDTAADLETARAIASRLDPDAAPLWRLDEIVAAALESGAVAT